MVGWYFAICSLSWMTPLKPIQGVQYSSGPNRNALGPSHKMPVSVRFVLGGIGGWSKQKAYFLQIWGLKLRARRDRHRRGQGRVSDWDASRGEPGWLIRNKPHRREWRKQYQNATQPCVNKPYMQECNRAIQGGGGERNYLANQDLLIMYHCVCLLCLVSFLDAG